MPLTYKDLLLEILKVINYQNNKDKFIKEFEELNHLETMTHILPHLSGDVQEKIKEYINDPRMIAEYIPKDIYTEELIKVSRESLVNFIKIISPVLNLKQKETIGRLVLPQ